MSLSPYCQALEFISQTTRIMPQEYAKISKDLPNIYTLSRLQSKIFTRRNGYQDSYIMWLLVSRLDQVLCNSPLETIKRPRIPEGNRFGNIQNGLKLIEGEFTSNSSREPQFVIVVRCIMNIARNSQQTSINQPLSI